MKWTDQQKEVIEARGVDILVSAAAGSGKTAVLTQRIIALIEEGYSLDDFLVITFTRAGAKEMKEKIRRQLLKKSKESGKAFFEEEVKKLPRAQISTIHSFCSAILKENFHLLDIDPNYRVAAEGERRLMEEESLDEVMEAYYKKEDPIFYELLEIFTNQRSDQGLREVIIQIETFLSQKPRRQVYLDKMKDYYQEEDFWWELLASQTRQRLEEFESIYNKTLPLIMTEDLLEFMEEERAMLYNLEKTGLSFKRFPTKKFMKEEANRVEIKAARDEWKKLFENSLAKKDFKELYKKVQHSFLYIEKLIEISESFHQNFFARRLQENKLSFSDLEHLALKAMEKEEVAQFYKEKFSFVFIDEYQDTNELQEYLVSLFVREGGLFMVGDVKQSIYGFREARPDLFIEKYHSYNQLKKKRRIDLTKNFRSARPILEASNDLFQKLMREDFGGLEYDDKARLVFGNKSLGDIEDQVEFLVTETPGDPHEEEIKSIISRIHQLIEEGYNYRDIVILYRSPKSFIEPAINLFRQAGLPLFSDQGESHLESLEVQILLNYLEVINNGFLDLPLLSLLRLPRYAFTDQELYDLRGKERYFHQGFYDYMVEGELLEKKKFFLEEIKKLRWKSRQMSVAELLHYLYQEVEFEEFALLMSGGEQRLMNIRFLFERAKEFEETTMVGLPAFLTYIDKLREQKQDRESAKLLGEDADVIRLMSIHKSKGLEFPLVFVAGLWKNYNEMSYRGPLFFDDDVFVMDFFDLEERRKERSPFKDILIEKSKIKARQEEIRLLYVAMTRAEKKLILSTYAKEEIVKGARLNTWELKRQKSFHDLLVKSTPEFKPPAPKYVMMKNIAYDYIDSPGPRGVEVASFNPPPPRKEAYKTSITSLISREEKTPSFELLGAEGGKERGTLFHKAMEFIDLDLAQKDLDLALKRLEELGLLKDFSDAHLVEVFLDSSLGKRVVMSPKILRERPFILKKDKRLVQGVVDLAFWEDGWVLVDYKTDRSFHYLDNYQRQLGLYKEAFEKITKEKVKEAFIYFLRLNKAIEIKEKIDES
ncbi:MAG TPA: UvrD-helicase domain-containing protein [Clostridia bacterium]|nr:UvrD-helicase domain-containing protein [Clostridia bacterium]